MNKKNNLSIAKRIENSKFDVVKKALHFVLLPVIILFVGIILISTVGFSQGIDFSGGQTFKVYVNDEAKLEGATVYNLSENKDYNEIYKKITLVLKEGNVSLVSYQTTRVNLADYDVYSGQAVQVTYQTNGQSKESADIRAELIDAFGYSEFDGAISSIDEVPSVYSYNWLIGLMAGIMFALVAAIIYMSIRYSTSAIFVMLIQTALDIFLTLGLLLIFRVPVNLTVGIVVLSTLFLSIFNMFVFYNKVKEGRKTGLYDKMKNCEIANSVTKQTAYKKALIYASAIIVSLLFIIISVGAVRSVVAGIMLALVATFYTSTFILPSFWAIADKQPKRKRKN